MRAVLERIITGRQKRTGTCRDPLQLWISKLVLVNTGKSQIKPAEGLRDEYYKRGGI